MRGRKQSPFRNDVKSCVFVALCNFERANINLVYEWLAIFSIGLSCSACSFAEPSICVCMFLLCALLCAYAARNYPADLVFLFQVVQFGGDLWCML